MIGAGVAGLAAALDLEEAGAEVVVLEARPRVGGRVLTLREPFAEGQYAEAGAQWVPGGHRTLRRWLDRFGIALLPSRTEDERRRLTYRHHLRGVCVDHRPDATIHCHLAGEATSLPFRFSPAEAQAGLFGLHQLYIASAYHLLDEENDLDSLTFTEFLRRQGATEDAIAYLRLGLYDDWGEGADTVSALLALRDDRLQREGGARIDIIAQGSDRFPRAMAGRFRGDLRLGTAVERITSERDGVRIQTVRRGIEETFSVDHVLCTVPLKVLSTIAFSPPLPERMAAAVREVRATSITRTYLQTKRRVWHDLGLYGDSITDLPMQAVVDATIQQAGTRGILTAYTAGPQARHLASLEEAERLRAVTADVEQVFPGVSVAVERTAVRQWDDDPFARGAFVSYEPGQITRHEGAFDEGHERITFAGEHTSRVPGWMEGSLRSSGRAVERVLQD